MWNTYIAHLPDDYLHNCTSLRLFDVYVTNRKPRNTLPQELMFL